MHSPTLFAVGVAVLLGLFASANANGNRRATNPNDYLDLFIGIALLAATVAAITYGWLGR